MQKVFDVPLAIDLSEFASFLWQNKIPHRIVEDDEKQTLYVPRHINAERVNFLFEQWKSGSEIPNIQVTVPLHQRVRFSNFPATLTIIGLSLLISILIGFGQNYDVMRWLTIVDFQVSGPNLIYTHLQETLTSMELWRLVSPAFMHFNLPHIIFNSLWIWVVGRKIEKIQGLSVFITIFFFSALVSNVAQFLISGPLFGGLSGVVFAVLAYTWLWDKLASYPVFGMPPALMIFMLVWLVLGYTGMLEALGFGSIANTAHLIGLISGLVAVPVIKLIFKRER